MFKTRSRSVDWERVKRRKISMFCGWSTKFDADDYEGMANVYTRFRTVDADSKSGDVNVVVLPGGDPNMPENPGLVAAHKWLRGLVPKQQMRIYAHLPSKRHRPSVGKLLTESFCPHSQIVIVGSSSRTLQIVLSNCCTDQRSPASLVPM